MVNKNNISIEFIFLHDSFVPDINKYFLLTSTNIASQPGYLRSTICNRKRNFAFLRLLGGRKNTLLRTVNTEAATEGVL